ncbi:Putative aldehyde dehydrogenase domain, aldehyde/histidinol dehydrogenase [Septoria linicola]|uniref:Aldehyde dehydrogenase domain, aldehyde/histidinol dehydrogenase n=1 Tax=Septoria linicola TaxID=215465 RepID=A0A9Q9EKH0_9PEZI|nr:putative aldehyde dehydrogenase domain, aldehyde/histidinol dehydrogenase [Septoria linicola]USW54796.1 Putative aldehyde dehydrogenase domain, aldehyde/histidinol dehydrogenase [Septoria linicola]
MRFAAANLKNVTLECGGKSPLIVFEDAEMQNAVQWAHTGIMDNSGQVCTSTSRIYVHETRFDEFVKAFVEYTEKVASIGAPFDSGVNHGPQVSRAQYDKVLTYLEQGKQEGAYAVTGGGKVDRAGYFVQPTVFVNAPETSTIIREEIFGPVVTISQFVNNADVVAKANDTQYGLAAALFTEKISRAHKVARKLKAGMVWINSSGDSHYGIPFGGFKSSGIGRELGSYALDAYTQTKAVHVNLAV